MSTRLRVRIERIGTRHWLSIPRCFLITIGTAVVGITAFALAKQWEERAGWPLWAVILMAVFILAGLGFLIIGVLGDKKAAEQWAQHSDRGGDLGSSVSVAMVAIPLFYFLKMIERE